MVGEGGVERNFESGKFYGFKRVLLETLVLDQDGLSGVLWIKANYLLASLISFTM